jgi:hypothetical protein
MKKIFILAFGLVSFVSTAQKTIVEEKFEKDNVPLSFHVLPNFNEISIEKGSIPSMSWKRNIKTVTRFNSDGTNKVLLSSGNQMDFENNLFDNSVFLASDFASAKWTNDFKVYSENSVSKLLDKNLKHSYFNNEFLFHVSNEDYNVTLDLLKDIVYLYKTNIKTSKTEKILLDIPYKNLNLKEYYKLKKLFIQTKYNKDNFEISYKLISPNLLSVEIVRFVFDYSGKLISNTKFPIDLGLNLVQSYNGSGVNIITSGPINSTKLPFNLVNDFNVIDMMDNVENQLAVNNYIVDNEKNLYFYGLFGTNGKKSIFENPKGFYISKFNSEGKLLWTKSDFINNKSFNNYSSVTNLQVKLFSKGDKLDFVIFTPKFNNILIFKELNSNTGSINIEKDITFEESAVMGMSIQKDFLLAFLHLKDWKKIRINPMGLVIYEINSKFKNYVDSLKNSKNKIYLNAHQFQKGIWLIESDNETYYKVTYFNHE